MVLYCKLFLPRYAQCGYCYSMWQLRRYTENVQIGLLPLLRDAMILSFEQGVCREESQTRCGKQGGKPFEQKCRQ